jgi:uncharacterized protein (DUF1810 family)
MTGEYNLQRFITAQDLVYEGVIGTLRRGAMCTTYMEVIFPRLVVCGGDGLAPETYAISSLDEARAYLSSRLLGGRYRECVGALQRLANRNAHVVFGEAGARKLHASLTLFSAASDDEFLLETMFDVWFDGVLDEETMYAIRQISG